MLSRYSSQRMYELHRCYFFYSNFAILKILNVLNWTCHCLFNLALNPTECLLFLGLIFVRFPMLKQRKACWHETRYSVMSQACVHSCSKPVVYDQIRDVSNYTA
jgi:hypothetical protein